MDGWMEICSIAQNPEITAVINWLQIKSATAVEEARALTLAASDCLSMVGGLAYIRTLTERDDLVQSAANFYVEGRLRAALDQWV